MLRHIGFSRKAIVTIIGILLITIIVTAFVSYQLGVRAQGGGLTANTLSAGPVAGAPSFTVFTDGYGNYYAKNQYGAISYSGTDAAAVGNNAINAMTSGTLLFGEGTFHFKTSLIPKSYITIEGESYTSTLFYLDSSSNVPLISASATSPDWLFNVILKDFGIDGNAAGQSSDNAAIYLSRIYESSISDCFIQDVKGNGIEIKEQAYSTVQDNIIKTCSQMGIYTWIESINCRVSGNNVRSCASESVLGSGPYYFGIGLSKFHNGEISNNNVYLCKVDNININYDCSYNTIVGNHADYSQNADGIVIDGEASPSDNNTVTGNEASYNALGKGIFIYCSKYNQISGNILSGNNEGLGFNDDGATISKYNTATANSFLNNYYGVLEEGSSDYNYVINNYFVGNTVPDTFVGSHSKSLNNQGTVTNEVYVVSGYAGAANGDWIAYDLHNSKGAAVTADAIHITASGTSAITFGVNNWNSTKFQVAASEAGTNYFVWTAERNP